MRRQRDPRVILPKVRDPRFIAVRRGGTLEDRDHRLLAVWAADCAAHVLHLFEAVRPDDDRPRTAIELARAWARGEIPWAEARTAAGHANGAARDLRGAARYAAYAAAQAAAVGHVAAHELGAAAYAIKAVRAGQPMAGARPRTPRRPAAANAAGSGSNCLTRSGISSSTTSGCATTCAGSCSTVRAAPCVALPCAVRPRAGSAGAVPQSGSGTARSSGGCPRRARGRADQPSR